MSTTQKIYKTDAPYSFDFSKKQPTPNMCRTCGRAGQYACHRTCPYAVEFTATIHTRLYGTEATQQGMNEQIVNMGGIVTFVNHTKGETTFRTSVENFAKIVEGLWYAITTINGEPVELTAEPPTPQAPAPEPEQQQQPKIKVKKMEKGHAEWMEPDTEGHYHPREKEDKPRWMCPCGLVWTMKHDAEECTARRHVPHYDMNYGGAIINGQYKGGVTYTVHAIRQEQVKGENKVVS